MPILFGKEKFNRARPPENLSHDEDLFYLDQTKEVFKDYDAYFERLIQLNSMEWSSSLSGRTGLTFEEAEEAENDARTFIDSFPNYLENPILFLIYTFSSRTRIDDLVNDVFIVMKDRYFIGEEVTYREKSSKKNARILNVTYSNDNWVPKKIKSITDEHKENGVSNKDRAKKLKQKPAEPELPPSNSYMYTIQIIKSNDSTSSSDDDDDESDEDDDGVREMVLHSNLIRSKDFSTKPRLKTFIKNATDYENGILIVKPSHVTAHRLEHQLWTSFFGGPMPEFPQMAKASRPKQSEKANKSITEKKEKKSTAHEGMNGATKKSENSKKKSESDNSGEKAKKLSKQQKKILAQQEELKTTFEQGERYGMVELEKWRQTERLLDSTEIETLKTKVKEAKELWQVEERERLKEQRKKEREELAERRKPRDDLLCDDLEPLPEYRSLILPPWMDSNIFAELLSVHQFFSCFSEKLNVTEDSPVSFSDFVNAIFSNNPQKSPISEILAILLRAKSDRANEEDGDEADIDNPDDIGNEANCDLKHHIHGERIREINRLHENYRITYGESPRNLTCDWLTVTEVLYLNLITSGYYPSGKVYTHRYFNRGGIRCYEDPGYEFVLEQESIIEKLSRLTIFELEPHERLEIIKVVIRQLLSYASYRETLDQRMSKLQEVKKQIKQLKIWDAAQEKEAKEAKLAREYEKEVAKEKGEKSIGDELPPEKPKISKEVLKIRAYVKACNDGRRVFNLDEIRTIFLEPIPYDELELYEIIEIRQRQKSFYDEKLAAVQNLLNELHGKLGLCFLGRDRTYRSYYYIDAIPIVLVENSNSLILGECDQPTPIESVSAEDEETLNAERKVRLACTGSTNSCVVHGNLRNFPMWSYLCENGTVDKLLKACNKRGFREIDLAENIMSIKKVLSETVDNTIALAKEEEIFSYLALTSQPEKFPPDSISENLLGEIRAMILDLEEKIETRAIGKIECSTNRETWQNALEQTGDTTAYCIKNEVRIKYTSKDAEPLFREDQLTDLNSVTKLAISLLQLAQGIKLECLNPPFTQEKDKKNPKVLPSTTFVNWQQELLSSTSISKIALLFNTLEMAIEWTQLRGQGNKCKICHKRGNIENLAQCRDCDRCYHTTCAKFKIPKLYDWQCPDCVDAEKIKQSKKKGRRLRDELENHKDMEDVFEDEMESDVGAGSSHEYGWSAYAEKNYSLRRGRTRGAPTQDDRKRRSTARASYINYFENDDSSYSDASSNDFTRKRRKHENLNIRALSMGLRESDSSEVKKQLHLCEEIVRETMRHECGVPFIDPYPDYIKVIKHPMDLRKIMSKLKYFDYDTAEQVWDDFKLIFDNCRTYNDDNSDLYEYADTLQSFVAEKFRKSFGVKV